MDNLDGVDVPEILKKISEMAKESVEAQKGEWVDEKTAAANAAASGVIPEHGDEEPARGGSVSTARPVDPAQQQQQQVAGQVEAMLMNASSTVNAAAAGAAPTADKSRVSRNLAKFARAAHGSTILAHKRRVQRTLGKHDETHEDEHIPEGNTDIVRLTAEEQLERDIAEIQLNDNELNFDLDDDEDEIEEKPKTPQNKRKSTKASPAKSSKVSTGAAVPQAAKDSVSEAPVAAAPVATSSTKGMNKKGLSIKTTASTDSVNDDQTATAKKEKRASAKPKIPKQPKPRKKKAAAKKVEVVEEVVEEEEEAPEEGVGASGVPPQPSLDSADPGTIAGGAESGGESEGEEPEEEVQSIANDLDDQSIEEAEAPPEVVVVKKLVKKKSAAANTASVPSYARPKGVTEKVEKAEKADKAPKKEKKKPPKRLVKQYSVHKKDMHLPPTKDAPASGEAAAAPAEEEVDDGGSLEELNDDGSLETLDFDEPEDSEDDDEEDDEDSLASSVASAAPAPAPPVKRDPSIRRRSLPKNYIARERNYHDKEKHSIMSGSMRAASRDESDSASGVVPTESLGKPPSPKNKRRKPLKENDPTYQKFLKDIDTAQNHFVKPSIHHEEQHLTHKNVPVINIEVKRYVKEFKKKIVIPVSPLFTLLLYFIAVV